MQRKMVVISILFFLVCLSAQAEDRKKSWRFDTYLYVLEDDNVNRAEAETDQIEDQAIADFIGVYYSSSKSLDRAMIYSFELEHRSYDKWDGVSNTSLAAGVEYRFRTRRGFTAPVYSITALLGTVNYKSELRDGDKAKLGLSVFKRLTDRVSVVGGLDFSSHDAESDIFDTDQLRWFGVLDYRLFSQSAIYLQYQYLDGDIVSSARPTPKLAAARMYWEAWGADDAFSNSSVFRAAYRFEAETDVWELGFTLGINKSNSFQVSVADYDSTTKEGNINYSGTRTRLDYLLRF